MSTKRHTAEEKAILVDSRQRVWSKQIHHPIEPDEYLANGQIKQHRASDAMIGDTAGGKHRAGDHVSQGG